MDIGSLVYVLAPVVVIAGLPTVFIAVIFRDRDQPAVLPPDPRILLATRLARGEITPAEFDTAMRALGYTDDPPAPPANAP